MRLRRAVSFLIVALIGGAADLPSSHLLEPWGGPAAFPPLYRQSIDALFTATDAYQQHDFQTASRIVHSFWDQHPPGTAEWASAISDAALLARTKGVNFGAPACYYALRMLTECVAWRLREPDDGRQPHSARLTVILVGQSSGIQATSPRELQEHQGRAVTHRLHPSMAANAAAIVEQSTWLFGEYVQAITDGRLALRSSIVPLPDVTVPVEMTSGSMQFATLAGGAEEKVWQAIPQAVKSVTDWWWIIYPSHFPEDSPELAGTEFITGGIGLGPDGQSPAFLIDDLWLLRKPSPLLGRPPYTEAERRAYLPEWFQHEFFHHLYRSYPEFRLEAKDHQWFDRQTWPADFTGLLEPDYYTESLHKRLQSASVPLHIALRYTPPPKDLFRKITPAMLRGKYRSAPVENGWHQGTIEWNQPPGARAQPRLRWINSAGVSWVLTPDLNNGLLQTEPDNPYYLKEPQRGRAFRVVLRRGADGEYLPEVAGFQFLERFYARIP